jgi:hypothetical protein
MASMSCFSASSFQLPVARLPPQPRGRPRLCSSFFDELLSSIFDELFCFATGGL